MKDPKELNKLAFELTAKLTALPILGPNGMDLLSRDSVMELVMEWRRKWDALAAAPSAALSSNPSAVSSEPVPVSSKPSAAPGDAQTWAATVTEAAEQSRQVFIDSCNHTQDAIEYMKQVLLAAAPAAPSGAQVGNFGDSAQEQLAQRAASMPLPNYASACSVCYGTGRDVTGRLCPFDSCHK